MGCLKISYYEQERALEVNPIFFTRAVEKNANTPIFCLSSSRYGFNGMEKDNEVKNITGAHYTTFWRQYDPRLGRWFSIDPETAKYADQSPYAFSFNNPINLNDPEGDDPCPGDGDGDGCDGANKNNKLKGKGKGKFFTRRKPKLKNPKAEKLVLEGAGKNVPILKTKKPKSKETEQNFKEGTITLIANSNEDEGDGTDRFIITAENKGRKHKGEVEVLFDEELPHEVTEPIKIKFKFNKYKKIKLTVQNDRNKDKTPGGFSGVVIVNPSNSKKKK